jgi:hypothetical protein
LSYYYTIKGAEIGLCTSSRERLGTCYAEPTQRRVRIAGVERGSSGGWRGSRESLGLRPPPLGRQGTTPRRPLATSTRNAGDTHQKVVCGKQQEEGGGKGRLTVAGGIEKDWGAVCLPVAGQPRFLRTHPRNASGPPTMRSRPALWSNGSSKPISRCYNTLRTLKFLRL